MVYRVSLSGGFVCACLYDCVCCCLMCVIGLRVVAWCCMCCCCVGLLVCVICFENASACIVCDSLCDGAWLVYCVVPLLCLCACCLMCLCVLFVSCCVVLCVSLWCCVCLYVVVICVI